jgi:hypothetical protein
MNNPKIKTYTVTLEYRDEKFSMIRRNDGFDPLELLGLAELISKEVREQMQEVIKPDVITREVVEKP